MGRTVRSSRNETIKAIRGLRRKQGDHLLLEGTRLVQAAIDAGLPIESALATPELLASEEGQALVRRLPRPPIEVAADVLERLADADSPRGLLALSRLERRGADAIPRLESGLYLFVDGVQEPGNLGALARVGAAFGVGALLLSAGCAHPNHPRALRGSAGSLLTLPVARELEVATIDARLASLAPSWAGLAAHGGEPLPAHRPAGTWIVAFGSEGRGLSDEVARRLDRRWTIPLARGVESLNVAVAAGISLHALGSNA